MTPVPPYALLLLGVTALIIGWICWRYFWGRHARPRSRVKAAFGGLMAGLLASFPAVFLLEALSTGEVKCLGRRCGGVTYDIAADPVDYWLRVVFLLVICLFFLSGTFVALKKPDRNGGSSV
ncbi:hypothetical protein ABQZ69_10045 [Xanthomonas sp. WHRI 8391]|uniref:hypothetical protein n=1 Tax=Xanthomonas TaxID=338 RepID=UPI001A19C74E|nr:hypothetical protein [Xanthomonas hortorum]MBG3849335.1 hypothetical protein [Xanthomonas hortorum pv. carotae]UTS74513.1 hypothetical protein NMB96_06835 [Xanthomonas hortorum]